MDDLIWTMLIMLIMHNVMDYLINIRCVRNSNMSLNPIYITQFYIEIHPNSGRSHIRTAPILHVHLFSRIHWIFDSAATRIIGVFLFID